MDRSACYMARYIAKNIVAAGLANACEVQLAYAIGVAEPVSVMVRYLRHRHHSDEKITELIRAHFPLTPRGIIETSICAVRSTARPPPSAISAAPSQASPGKYRQGGCAARRR